MRDSRPSPTVRLRRLSRELRRLREVAGLNVAEAAKRAGWAQSALSRAENRIWRQPSADTVGRLLDVYGITEEARPTDRAELLRLVAEARKRGWWTDYSISSEYSTFVGLEAEAERLRNFEPNIIPGLLQTAAYASALIHARAPGLSTGEVAERVELRLERQQRLLHGREPLDVWAIFGEEALCRPVGGAEVMAEQLDHLRKVAALDSVNLQVLPLSAGAGPASSPFAVLTFGERTDPEAVYVETGAGDLWLEDAALVAGYLAAFERLIGVSATVPDSLKLIEARGKLLAHGR